MYANPLGDTTRVRNLRGELLHTIDDNLPNETHFTNQEYDFGTFNTPNVAAEI